MDGVATRLLQRTPTEGLLYVAELDDSGKFSDRFVWGAVISLFFLFEISLRFYVWAYVVGKWSEHRAVIGGFITNPFRALDTSLVVLDIFILVFTLFDQSSSAVRTKGFVKVTKDICGGNFVCSLLPFVLVRRSQCQ